MSARVSKLDDKDMKISWTYPRKTDAANQSQLPGKVRVLTPGGVLNQLRLELFTGRWDVSGHKKLRTSQVPAIPPFTARQYTSLALLELATHQAGSSGFSFGKPSIGSFPRAVSFPK